MFNNIQNGFYESLQRIAEHNLLKKLNLEGIYRSDLEDFQYAEYLNMEVEICKNKFIEFGLFLSVSATLIIFAGGYVYV